MPDLLRNGSAASGLQLQPIAGTSQIVLAGQTFQPVMVRVTDLSTPPNPVQGATVLSQYIGGDLFPSALPPPYDWNPMPVIFFWEQSSATSDTNGLASLQPTTAGFTGALDVMGTASAGQSNVSFLLKVLPAH